jgi:RNA polymerase sigma-70 factor (ECF subfamily)
MGVLFARYHVRLYRFIVRLTGNAAMAEDLASDVFLDVWRSARQFQARSQVTTWLLAIARYKTLSALGRRVDETLDEQAAASIEDPSDDPETTADKEARSTLVRNCLSQLSAAHREVMDLVYYHDKSVDEIARIVGILPNTVKTRMFCARSKMAGLLRQAGIEAL